LELFTVEAVLHRLDSPELAAILNGRPDDGESAGWQSEIEQATEQLDELAGMWGSKEISRSEYLTAGAAIRKRQDVARKRLAALNRSSVISDHIGNGAGLRERWAGLTLTRQQQIVAAVLDHLVVSPARVRGSRQFDHSRLSAVWRA
jgi:hypothetical protein